MNEMDLENAVMYEEEAMAVHYSVINDGYNFCLSNAMYRIGQNIKSL